MFNNVITAFVQINASLRVALTESDTQNNKKMLESISLVGLFKKVGFKTFWISTQQPLRAPTKPFATIADEQFFMSMVRRFLILKILKSMVLIA